MSYCEATWLAVKTPAGLICPPIVELGFFPVLGPVSRKSRELFGFEKPFVKLRPGCSVKLIFSHVVKGIRIKITAKFRASRRLRFEDTKRIMLPEIRPKSFGAFEKRAPDLFYFTRTFELLHGLHVSRDLESSCCSQKVFVTSLLIRSLNIPFFRKPIFCGRKH